MPRAEFEPAAPSTKRPQTYALDRAATVIGMKNNYMPRFTPEERTPGNHSTGGWVGPRAGLDTETRGKILSLCRGSNLDRP
jgi:hypothetical protein